MAGSKGTHTKNEWQTLILLCGTRCLACNQSGLPLTKDHILPVSRGGSDSIDNIQPLCRSCNSKKGIKCIDYVEWEIRSLMRAGKEVVFSK